MIENHTAQTKENNTNNQFTRTPYRLGEEIMNSITHGIGTLLSLIALIVLVYIGVAHKDIIQIVSFSIYGVSLILLYLASTLYHAIPNPGTKRKLRVFDHAAIYLLIAGSYTPFLLIGLKGTWGWTLMAVIWGLALLGVSFKLLFIEHFQKLSVLTYILMGWISVIMIKEMVANIPIGGLIWLAAGGVFYTVGVIFYALKKVPYMHGVWHLFVLGGSLCHFIAIYLYLAPLP